MCQKKKILDIGDGLLYFSTRVRSPTALIVVIVVKGFLLS